MNLISRIGHAIAEAVAHTGFRAFAVEAAETAVNAAKPVIVEKIAEKLAEHGVELAADAIAEIVDSIVDKIEDALDGDDEKAATNA